MTTSRTRLLNSKHTGVARTANAGGFDDASRRLVQTSRFNGLAVLLICMLSVIAYSNSLQGNFVFDDTDQIVENQSLRSWSNLADAFTTHVWAFRESAGDVSLPPPLPYYRPLFTVLLTVEYHIFGLWSPGWHLTNLVLHVICAVELFCIFRLLSGRELAVFTAMIFAVHPVHAESVAWISGVTDPLYSVFFLAAFYFYLKSRGLGQALEERAGSRKRDSGSQRASSLYWSLALFVAAAYSKETALSFVPLVIVFEMIYSDGIATARLKTGLRRAIPYATAALLYLIPRLLVLGESMFRNPQATERPFTHTLLTMPFVVTSYLFHLVWPVELSVTYATQFITSASSVRFIVPLIGLTCGAAVICALRKKIDRVVWLALALAFLTLLPVLNLGQVSRPEYLVFDHYLYLAVAGWAYVIARAVAGLGGSIRRLGLTEGVRNAVVGGAAILILVAHTAAATKENAAWADSYSLWSNVARVRPAYWAGYYNAALALLGDKKYGEAASLLQQAAELKPDESVVFDALGRASAGLGDARRAIECFERALAINPEMFEANNNLGTVYFNAGEYARAEAGFAAALRLRPQASASRFNLGLCYARQGKSLAAAREFELAIQGLPEDGEAFYELGLAYEKVGRKDDAVRALERGLALAESSELANKCSERLSILRAGERRP